MMQKILRTFFLFFIAFYFTGLTYSQSGPPSNLEATFKDNVVKLSWEAPEKGEKVTYNIYRAETMSSGNAIDPTKLEFSKISTTTETAYKDKEAASEKGYIYYVVALDSKGVESAGSNYINVRVGDKSDDTNKDKYEN